MQRYFDTVLNNKGEPAVGLTVTVMDSNGNKATLYSDNGATQASNPLLTDRNGEFAFYVANGHYSITISGNGIAPLTIPDVLIQDATDAVTSAADSAAAALAAQSAAATSASAAHDSQTNAANSATSAAASAAKLPDISATNANQFLQVNTNGTGYNLNTQAQQRSALGLGSASTQNVGTAPGNVVQLDASGKLPSVDGAQVKNLPSVASLFKNLKITNGATANSQVALTADEILLENGSNAFLTVRSVNLTINTGTAGANGLDTGTVAASVWYSVWVISNGTTTAGLISTSATNPTLPSGYTYKARLGWVRTDASGNLMRTLQLGRKAQYVVTAGSNTTALPVLISGAQGSFTTPTWVAASINSAVPATASTIRLIASNPATGGSMAAAPNNSYGAYNSTTNPPPLVLGTNGFATNVAVEFTLESTNIYYAGAANCSMWCLGWEDNI